MGSHQSIVGGVSQVDRRSALIALLCTLTLVVSGGCAARQPARSFSDLQQRLHSGNTVYVIDNAGGETKGKIVEVSASAMVLDINGTRRRMEEDSVRQVQRFGDSLWNGLLIGAAVGTAGMLIADPTYRALPERSSEAVRGPSDGSAYPRSRGHGRCWRRHRRADSRSPPSLSGAGSTPAIRKDSCHLAPTRAVRCRPVRHARFEQENRDATLIRNREMMYATALNDHAEVRFSPACQDSPITALTMASAIGALHSPTINIEPSKSWAERADSGSSRAVVAFGVGLGLRRRPGIRTRRSACLASGRFPTGPRNSADEARSRATGSVAASAPTRSQSWSD